MASFIISVNKGNDNGWQINDTKDQTDKASQVQDFKDMSVIKQRELFRISA